MLRSLRELSPRDILYLGGFILLINGIGSLPALFVGSDTSWIERPWFYPPEVLFPIVWTVLFSLMGISLYLIVRSGVNRRSVRIALLVFAIQFLINVMWTPVFFGLRRVGFGLVIILVLWIMIVATIITFARVQRTAALLLVPYLAWVSFAAILNAAIVLLMS